MAEAVPRLPVSCICRGVPCGNICGRWWPSWVQRIVLTPLALRGRRAGFKRSLRQATNFYVRHFLTPLHPTCGRGEIMTYAIRSTLRAAALCGATVLVAVGCNKKDDNHLNFTSAINTYSTAHPSCLWSEPMKFPVQADTSDTNKTSGFDALVDQGLLVRTTAEKKKILLGSKQVNNYDLSDKGRSVWTADTQQP